MLLNEEEADLDKPVEKSATTSYSSRHKRNVFSCVSEDKALARLLNTLDCAKDDSPGKSDGTIFVGEDEILICVGCGYEARSSSGTSFIHREVALDTLHHGGITIWVTHFVCGYCNEFAPYDGLVDGIFCVNKRDLFSREL